uniref:Cell death inducing DFFA like effector a n=1 Tax=Amphilophus citrinellus TaxID=61819 RepID=A0A3Q0R880_AMPCI
MLSCQFLILVLEEDGTVVDSEEFFHSLPNNTLLMVLENGDMWTKGKIIPCFRQPKRNRIAKLTFDLYKLQPKDFLCCFTIRGTLYETYTLSYDFRFTRIKHLLDPPDLIFTFLHAAMQIFGVILLAIHQYNLYNPIFNNMYIITP